MYERLDISEFSNDLILPAFVTIQELKYAYINADGFIYPSLYEGFGLPPLEAMACGTQVVSSDRSSLPEILNGFALLVDPTDIEAIGDAMIEVATENPSPSRRQELRNHARTFSWERAADQLIEVINETIDVD
jgi:glycosyltransferase involved in cell wall biosynthesis